MEFLLLIGLYYLFKFCRDLTKISQGAQAQVERELHLIQARQELARLSKEAASIRRDIDQFRDDGGDPIPPGAPDPLADFLRRRKENLHG